MIYKTLVLTGLRKGELALDDPHPYAELNAADEKNRKGSRIPLRPDLASDLRRRLTARLDALRDEARASGTPLPTRLP